jgi:hypothetical protein
MDFAGRRGNQRKSSAPNAELLNGDIEGEGLGAVAVHANNATARAGFPNPARVKGAE